MTDLPKLALRIDDIGAASKQFNYYTKRRLLNIGILRDRRLLGAWAPYREMTPLDWEQVYLVLKKYSAKLTVAITATWVHEDSTQIPFHHKFPQEAAILKEGMQDGLLEIANHGLTHCVLQNQSFKPGLFKSNRTYHREFWHWLPNEVHHEHVQKAQDLLQDYFQTPIVTLVPPGNTFCDATIEAAQQAGLKILNCQTQSRNTGSLKVIGNEHVLDFHDRELVLEGVSWLEKRLQPLQGKHTFCFVKEL